MHRTLTLSIDPPLFARFPSLRLDVFVAVHLDRRSLALAQEQATAIRPRVALHAYDVDALPNASILVRTASPQTDWFVPLGARPTDTPLGRDDVVHAAGPTVLGRAFTAHESRQTCLCATTRRAAFVAQTTSTAQAVAAANALRTLRRLLAREGALVSDVAVVNARAPEAVLPCDDAVAHW